MPMVGGGKFPLSIQEAAERDLSLLGYDARSGMLQPLCDLKGVPKTSILRPQNENRKNTTTDVIWAAVSISGRS